MSRGRMESRRDFNAEARDTGDHCYIYQFDRDVMHPFMLRTFELYFKVGNALELGSFRGDFTERLLRVFRDVTCVEASDEAVEIARQRLGNRARIHCATFEAVQLHSRYDNVILTHVLEHMDDPVGLLRRIGTQWLAPHGRLFVACPNANAPSRQIAVRMGLIPHNAAVTLAEANHGHRRTYALDTLEADIRDAGFDVTRRGGIFFKALANFQWDRLLNTGIVSRAYLQGCYELGQVYPDLCSSIFVVCEQSER